MPGMAGLTNLDSEVWDTETVADRLVHEAIHALVFKENLADGALVSSPDTKVRVVSPWSGSRLELLTFMHAAFVWFGLWHFWRRAGARAPARRRAGRAGTQGLRRRIAVEEHPFGRQAAPRTARASGASPHDRGGRFAAGGNRPSLCALTSPQPLPYPSRDAMNSICGIFQRTGGPAVRLDAALAALPGPRDRRYRGVAVRVGAPRLEGGGGRDGGSRGGRAPGRPRSRTSGDGQRPSRRPRVAVRVARRSLPRTRAPDRRRRSSCEPIGAGAPNARTICSGPTPSRCGTLGAGPCSAPGTISGPALSTTA